MSVGTPPADTTLFAPLRRAAVDASSADVDLTALFPSKYAVAIYVGGTGDIALLGVGDSVATVYKAVPVGTWIRGAFQTLVHANTTATHLVAEGN